MYSTTHCPYCRQAERLLRTLGVPFKEIDVTGDEAMREELVRMTGGRRTVPQIFIGEEPIGGYTDLVALHHAGQLNAKLEG